MPTIINHCHLNIVTLDSEESMQEHCIAGDIAIVRDAAGWWTNFIGEQGQVDRYDAPFDSYNQALWAAKAAAEYADAET